MNRKSGILSDKHFEENCNEYTAIPLGYINSNYLGFLGNPNLPGIKPTKYPRTAPRPASADVMAVNTARMQGGNLAKNARKILDLYQVGVRDWTPPEVNLMTQLQEVNDSMHRIFPGNNQAVSILPRRQTHLSIGSQITGDTMGRTALTAEMGTDTTVDSEEFGATVFPNGMSQTIIMNALASFRNASKEQQSEIGRRMFYLAQDNGVMVDGRMGGGWATLSGGRGNANNRLEMVGNIILEMMHLQTPIDLEAVFMMPTARNIEAAGSSSDPPPLARQATTETDLSAARTAEPMPREGIPEPQTASESPETEYR